MNTGEFVLAGGFLLLTVLLVLGFAGWLMSQSRSGFGAWCLSAMGAGWVLALLNPLFSYPVALWAFALGTVGGLVAFVVWVAESVMTARKFRKNFAPNEGVNS